MYAYVAVWFGSSSPTSLPFINVADHDHVIRVFKCASLLHRA